MSKAIPRSDSLGSNDSDYDLITPVSKPAAAPKSPRNLPGLTLGSGLSSGGGLESLRSENADDKNSEIRRDRDELSARMSPHRSEEKSSPGENDSKSAKRTHK